MFQTNNHSFAINLAYVFKPAHTIVCTNPWKCARENSFFSLFLFLSACINSFSIYFHLIYHSLECKHFPHIFLKYRKFHFMNSLERRIVMHSRFSVFSFEPSFSYNVKSVFDKILSVDKNFLMITMNKEWNLCVLSVLKLFSNISSGIHFE